MLKSLEQVQQECRAALVEEILGAIADNPQAAGTALHTFLGVADTPDAIATALNEILSGSIYGVSYDADEAVAYWLLRK